MTLCAALPLVMLPVFALAQTGAAQARLEADCLRRLDPLVPPGVDRQGASFSALGNYAVYYVVSYKFSGELRNGSRAAACTYRRDGEWVRDDAHALRMARDHATARQRAKAD